MLSNTKSSEEIKGEEVVKVSIKDTSSTESDDAVKEGGNAETNTSQIREEKAAKDIFEIIQNSSDKVPFIGVAGAGAAGKSYFCQQIKEILKNKFNIEALVVTMDGYHYYRHQLDKMDDPEHAYARRGAEFTFDAQRFVKEISQAKQEGVASFPDFDHAKKDPEENKINFDSSQHQVVIVEGLYVLLDKDPWGQLKDVFNRTFFLDTKDELIIQRHKVRMTTQMGLTDKEAEERIFGNDLVNAKFIKENTCFEQHTLFKIED